MLIFLPKSFSTTKEVLPLTTNSLDKAGSTIINVINTILTPFDMANLYAENAKKNFAHKLQPKMFLFENVKGLKSHDKGRTYKTILELFIPVCIAC